MGNAKKREFALGLVMLCAGLLLLLLTFNLPRKGFVDAAFVPYVLGFAMCVLGAVQLAAAKHMAVATADAGGTAGGTEAGRRIDYATVLRTVGLIIGYVALIDYVGFPIMTALYLYAQFLVLTPSGDKTRHLLYGTIAIVAAAAIHITFRFGFDLMLPTGLLD